MSLRIKSTAAILPRHTAAGTGDCRVVTGTVVDGSVGVSGEVVVAVAVAFDEAVGTVTALTGTLQVSPDPLHSTLNVVDAVTSCRTPETFTRYISGAKEEVSTSKDQVFLPPLPATTFTVPLAPDNPDDCVLVVGIYDDE